MRRSERGLRRADPGAPSGRAPALVRLADPLGRLLLRMGVPMGPDALVTIRGRHSGLPRTVALAVVELGARRYIVGTYGEVDWVRNLRAAGEAEIHVGGARERVQSHELDPEGAARTLTALADYIHGLPWLLRVVTRSIIRLSGAGEILDEPAAAAGTRPVFELRRAR